MTTFSGHDSRLELASIAAPATYVEMSKFVLEVDWTWPQAEEDITPLEAAGTETYLDIPSDDLMIRFRPDITPALWLLANSRNLGNVQIGVKWSPLKDTAGRPLYTGSGVVRSPNFRAPNGAIALSCTVHINPNQAGGLAWAQTTH